MPWCLLFLVALSFLFGHLFDRWHERVAESQRNPHLRRGWVEHTMGATPKQDGEKLIVLLSNSQGYGFETPDDQTYAAALERKLGEKLDQPVRVLNWSIAGGQALDFIFTGAATHRLDPDLVLLSTSPRNFTAGQMLKDPVTHEFHPRPADTHFLTGYRQIRRHIPSWMLRYLFKPSDVFGIALARIWRPWRYRELPAAWMSRFRTFRFFEKKRHTDWFRLEGPPDGRNKKKREQRELIMPPVDWRLVDVYLQATDALGDKRVYVSMPLRINGPKEDAFDQEIEKRFEAAGATMWDLSDSLTDDMFLTRSHLNEQGHEAMATMLAERIAP